MSKMSKRERQITKKFLGVLKKMLSKQGRRINLGDILIELEVMFSSPVQVRCAMSIAHAIYYVRGDYIHSDEHSDLVIRVPKLKDVETWFINDGSLFDDLYCWPGFLAAVKIEDVATKWINKNCGKEKSKLFEGYIDAYLDQ